ncbi:M50 family metallopeptidase [Timonella senegalensis]|uniref:M50 family metallopeptidase n=1 Tax=Timonella senegalensis TaxID=1465825 RepID=UPI002FDE65D6
MSNDKGWTLGHVAGTPVHLRPNALLMVGVFAALYFPLFSSRAASQGGAIAASVALGAVILVSIFVHEVAHVLVAKSYGVRADEISLNMLGGHASFTSQFKRPWHGAVTALSGPLANVMLGLVFLVIVRSASEYSIVLEVVNIAAVMNFFLALFNALPGLPLDGGSAVSALIWNFTGSQSKGLTVAARIGQAVAVLWLLWAVVRPLLQGHSPDIVILMWTLMLVMVLWSGATASLRRAKYLQAVEKLDLASITTPARTVVAHTSVREVVSQMLGAHDSTTTVVLSETGNPIGYVDPLALSSVGVEVQEYTPVAAVSIPLLPGGVIDATARPQELLSRVNVGHDTRTLYVVAQGGRVTGVVWVASLMRALNLH